jgi:TadE-like protein
MSRQRRSGQALVEFAFVFPIIMLMVFGFIDIGRAVFAFNTITNAAREGARVAIVSQSDPVAPPWNCIANKPVEVTVPPNWTFRGCAVTAGQSIGVTPADIAITYRKTDGSACGPPYKVGCLAVVTVQSTYTPLTPLANLFIRPITLSATSEMPIERVFP